MRHCESHRRTVTEHVIYCQREEEHRGPCVFSDGNGMHFWLSGYEISNLRALFAAIDLADGHSPLKQFANGDWFHQIKSKITDGFILPNNPPNRTPEQMLTDFTDSSASSVSVLGETAE